MVQSVLTDQPTDRPLGQSSSERFYEAMRFHLAFLFQQFVVWFDLAWLGYCRRCRILSINTSIKFQSNSQGIPTRSAYILSSKITCRHLQALSVSQSVRPSMWTIISVSVIVASEAAEDKTYQKQFTRATSSPLPTSSSSSQLGRVSPSHLLLQLHIQSATMWGWIYAARIKSVQVYL